LHVWLDQLASGRGLCCSFAGGFKVENVDWDTQDGHYRVRLHGQWIVVPKDAVVTEPNKFGPAVVWPYTNASGNTQIRCFMPGRALKESEAAVTCRGPATPERSIRQG
jgi:hypothetical protein